MTNLTRNSPPEEIIGAMCEAFIRGLKRRKGPDPFGTLRERKPKKTGSIAKRIHVLLEDEVAGRRESKGNEFSRNKAIASELGSGHDYVREVRKRWKEGKLSQ
jgi:hypothetical protein